MPIVKMPDGTQVQFPDNMPSEQIKGMIASKFPDAVPKSFTERVGEDINKRLEASKTAPDLANFLISSARIGVGVPADIASETIKSGYNMLPEAVQQPIEKVGKAVVEQPLVKKGLQFAEEKAKEYPTLANALGLVSELPVGAIATKVGASATGKVLGTGRKAINELSDRFATEKVAKKAVTSAQDKAVANRLYKLSEEADIQFQPDNLSELNKNLSSLIPKTDAEKRAWGKSSASRFVQDLQETMQVEPLTLNGALAQRTVLNDEISAAYRAGKNAEANKLMEVKDALDKTMMNPETSAWQEANHIWGKASTKQDLEDMVLSAQDKAQPANSLDTAISNYIRKNSRNLRENEKLALRSVIGEGGLKEVGKNLSSRLISHVATGVGASVGGLPGAAIGNLVGTYGSMFARDLTMMNKLKKLDKVFELIDNRPMKGIK
jgi:hypothetical protein